MLRFYKMNENKLRRLFPNASKSFIKANSDRVDDSRVSDKSEQVDREEVCEAPRGKKVGAEYSLSSCEILYWCRHGQLLDPSDNQSYAAIKPIADALVNIGTASNDKEFKAKASQRMDENKANF